MDPQPENPSVYVFSFTEDISGISKGDLRAIERIENGLRLDAYNSKQTSLVANNLTTLLNNTQDSILAERVLNIFTSYIQLDPTAERLANYIYQAQMSFEEHTEETAERIANQSASVYLTLLVSDEELDTNRIKALAQYISYVVERITVKDENEVLVAANTLFNSGDYHKIQAAFEILENLQDRRKVVPMINYYLNYTEPYGLEDYTTNEIEVYLSKELANKNFLSNLLSGQYSERECCLVLDAACRYRNSLGRIKSKNLKHFDRPVAILERELKTCDPRLRGFIASTIETYSSYSTAAEADAIRSETSRYVKTDITKKDSARLAIEQSIDVVTSDRQRDNVEYEYALSIGEELLRATESKHQQHYIDTLSNCNNPISFFYLAEFISTHPDSPERESAIQVLKTSQRLGQDVLNADSIDDFDKLKIIKAFARAYRAEPNSLACLSVEKHEAEVKRLTQWEEDQHSLADKDFLASIRFPALCDAHTVFLGANSIETVSESVESFRTFRNVNSYQTDSWIIIFDNPSLALLADAKAFQELSERIRSRLNIPNDEDVVEFYTMHEDQNVQERDSAARYCWYDPDGPVFKPVTVEHVERNMSYPALTPSSVETDNIQATN